MFLEQLLWLEIFTLECVKKDCLEEYFRLGLDESFRRRSLLEQNLRIKK